jgi:hypothetical protein
MHERTIISGKVSLGRIRPISALRSAFESVSATDQFHCRARPSYTMPAISCARSGGTAFPT